MNVRLYGQVFWRFRFLVLGGFILALLLAMLSIAKVSFVHGSPTLVYRKAEIWAANEVLVVTGPGFPEGQAIFPQPGSSNSNGRQFVDPGRLAYLADYYSRLANSDAVRSRDSRLQNHRLSLVTAAPVTSYATGQAQLLPMLTIVGETTTSRGALALTRAASAAFRGYLADRQTEAGIPDNQRVVVSVLNRPTPPTVVQPRKKTIAIMVFVAVLAAALVLALILENLRPRPKIVEQPSLRGLAEERLSRASVGHADAGR